MRELKWVGSSRRDLKEFPEDVQGTMGFALFQAQIGGKHPSTKPLRGHKGAGVLEVVDDFDGDTYRCVYTVRFEDAVYVLHAFQKKSTHGIETPEREMRTIEARLRQIVEGRDGR